MRRPLCLVCGKPIAKKTYTIYFREAGISHDHGDVVEGTYYSQDIYVDPDKVPQTKAEAQKWSNLEVISVSRGSRGIYSVNVWDGVSYTDPHFHSESCAAIHGRRAAKAGYR